MIIVGTFSYAQSRSTFYIKKKDNGDVKKVYLIGERVKLVYGYSQDSIFKLKGLINEISEDKIKVDDKWIEVSSIREIISHGFFNTFIGSVGLAISLGVILRPKQEQEPNYSGIFTQEESNAFRTLFTVYPILLSSTALLLIPINYGHKKFIFKTYLAPKNNP
jgi:hypothetical protein